VPADPGTARSRTITLILAVLLTVVVIGMQNVPPLVEFFEETAPVEQTEQPVVTPPQVGDPPNTLGRLYIKMGEMVAQDPQAMPMLDRFCVTDADRLRAAVVAGELLGDDAARERLDNLIERLDEGNPVREDAADLRPVYDAGIGEAMSQDPGGPDDETPVGRDFVPEAAAERLVDHHGYYAEVALTHGLPDDHPDRAPLLDGGFALMALALGMFAALGLALVAGTVLFIVGLVLASTGRLKPRMAVPEPGGSVYLEVFVLFVGGFLALKFGMDALHKVLPDAMWLGMLSIALQWCLIAVVFWPRLRGVSDVGHGQAMGWHGGMGFFREVGFGILGYLAGLPVYVAGLVLTIVAMLIAEAVRANFVEGPPPLPNQNLFDIIGGSSPFELILFMSLAVLWAPLCEESVFRGALFRHFRARWALPVAALGSAALFGFMHGYGPLFVFPLIALGTVFAIMREWRGSLIAPITAHMLHNGTVTVLLLVMIRILA